jgi:hypothetical protein
MIEQKIDALIEKIDKLTLAIQELTVGVAAPIRMEVLQAEERAPEPIDSQTPSDAPCDAISTEPILEEGSVSVTASDLQKICMDLVRKNKENKHAIKNVLNRFNASLIKDLDSINYNKVKAELELI